METQALSSQIDQLRIEALSAIAEASDAVALKEARVRYLGKTGSVSLLSEGMRTLSKEERPVMGKLLNDLRAAVTAALDEKESALTARADAAALSEIDFSLPGTAPEAGSLHPLTLLVDRAVQIFRRLGFAIADGPDIETEWHCFDALNTPADHPARNEQDTFYLPDGRLLSTHTS